MGIKTIISCETFGCHVELISFHLMAKKEVTKWLKEYEWVIVKHKGNLPDHSYHCQDCVRNKRV